MEVIAGDNKNVRGGVLRSRNALTRSVIISAALLLAVMTVDFIPDVAMAADPAVTHVVAYGWMATDFHDQANPGCSIASDGSVPGGRLMMGANRRRPDPMNLVIRKSGWVIPPGTPVQVQASFPDGSLIRFDGHGTGQKIEIDIASDQLRGWVHELTASATMQMVFGGNEPPWTFDLSGTTAVVNAMGDCFRDHQVSGVAPPFDNTAIAAGEGTQPFSLAQSTQAFGAAPATQPFGGTLPPTEKALPDAVTAPPRADGGAEASSSAPASSQSYALPVSTSRAGTAPASSVDVAERKTCKEDLRNCQNIEDAVNNFSGIIDAVVACKMAANKEARFGDPEWGWLTPSFGSFLIGGIREDELKKTQKLLLFPRTSWFRMLTEVKQKRQYIATCSWGQTGCRMSRLYHSVAGGTSGNNENVWCALLQGRNGDDGHHHVLVLGDSHSTSVDFRA